MDGEQEIIGNYNIPKFLSLPTYLNFSKIFVLSLIIDIIIYLLMNISEGEKIKTFAQTILIDQGIVLLIILVSCFLYFKQKTNSRNNSSQPPSSARENLDRNIYENSMRNRGMGYYGQNPGDSALWFFLFFVAILRFIVFLIVSIGRIIFKLCQFVVRIPQTSESKSTDNEGFPIDPKSSLNVYFIKMLFIIAILSFLPNFLVNL